MQPYVFCSPFCCKAMRRVFLETIREAIVIADLSLLKLSPGLFTLFTMTRHMQAHHTHAFKSICAVGRPSFTSRILKNVGSESPLPGFPQLRSTLRCCSSYISPGSVHRLAPDDIFDTSLILRPILCKFTQTNHQLTRAQRLRSWFPLAILGKHFVSLRYHYQRLLNFTPFLLVFV